MLVMWVIKDIALYPFLRSAYEVDDRQPIERLIGERGTTVEPLAPSGYVRVGGELWYAETKTDIPEVSVADAVMLLDLRDTNALFFKNAGSGRHNMVYRRHDGSIGWVEPH